MPAAQRYPIQAVSRMTGLSLDTLRAWERRYAVVSPARGQRGRLYTDRQVNRLKQLAGLVERGHTISEIAALGDAALQRLVATESPMPAATAGPAVDIEPLRRAIALYDRDAIDAFLARHAMLLSPPEFILGIVAPALRDVGDRWADGVICPAQEHLFSGNVRGLLGALLRALPQRPHGRTTVFATPSGDRHELGLLCAAVLAAWAGHAVTYLGADLPAADVMHAVKSLKASRVVLAATAAGAADGPDLSQLRRLPSSVSIVAGGAQADSIRKTVGPRVQTFASLEDFRRLVDRDAH